MASPPDVSDHADFYRRGPYMRIAVGDVWGWLASGMSEANILEDFPELTGANHRAALAFAAERERTTTVAAE